MGMERDTTEQAPVDGRGTTADAKRERLLEWLPPGEVEGVAVILENVTLAGFDDEAEA